MKNKTKLFTTLFAMFALAACGPKDPGDDILTGYVYENAIAQAYFANYSGELPEFPDAEYTLTFKSAPAYGTYLEVTASDGYGTILSAFTSAVQAVGWNAAPVPGQENAYFASDTGDESTCSISLSWFLDEDDEGDIIFVCDIHLFGEHSYIPTYSGGAYSDPVFTSYIEGYTGMLPNLPEATYTVTLLEDMSGETYLEITAPESGTSLQDAFTANVSAINWGVNEGEDELGVFYYAFDTYDDDYSISICWYDETQNDGSTLFVIEFTYYPPIGGGDVELQTSEDVYSVNFVQEYLEEYEGQLPQFPQAVYQVYFENSLYGAYIGVLTEDTDGAILTAFTQTVSGIWTVDTDTDEDGSPYYFAFDTDDIETCSICFYWYSMEVEGVQYFACEITYYGDDSGDVIDAEFITVSQAVAQTKALGNGNTSSEEVAVGGYVSTSFKVDVSTQVEGTYRFNMSDSGEKEDEELVVWWGTCDVTPEQGDFVVVVGKLYNYQGTKYEIVDATIYVISGGDIPGEYEYYMYDTFAEAGEVFFQNISYVMPTLPDYEWEFAIIYDSDWEEYYLDITTWLDNADQGETILTAVNQMFTNSDNTITYVDDEDYYEIETDDLYICFFQDVYEGEYYVSIQYSFIDPSNLTYEDINGSEPVDPVTPPTGEGYGTMAEPISVANAITIFNNECKGKTATASKSKIYVQGYVVDAGAARNDGGLKNLYISDNPNDVKDSATSLKLSCLLNNGTDIKVGDVIEVVGYLYSFDSNTKVANMYYTVKADTSTYPTLVAKGGAPSQDTEYEVEYDNVNEAIVEFFKGFDDYPSLPELPEADYSSSIYFDESINDYVLEILADDENEQLVDAFETNILADQSGLWGDARDDGYGGFFMYDTNSTVYVGYGNDLIEIDDDLIIVFYLKIIRMDEAGYSPEGSEQPPVVPVVPENPEQPGDDGGQTQDVELAPNELLTLDSTYLKDGSDGNTSTWVKGDVTITITKGTAQASVANMGYNNPFRTYAGQIITITWERDAIPVEIIMTTDNSKSNNSNITASATGNVVGATGTVKDNVVTYTVTGNSVVITVNKTGDTSKQLWIESINVIFEK